MNKKTVALTTLGCKVNQSETETMAGLFHEAGYETVPFEQAADVYVINTCSVTSLSDRKSRQLIRRAHAQNENAVIAAVGCYAELEADEVAALPGVRVIIGSDGKKEIVELVERAAKSAEMINRVGEAKAATEFEDIALGKMPKRTRAFLKIEDGCQNFCSYCIIPYARGKVRSRTMPSICREVKKLCAGGFREIVLTGIHLGLYGRDLSEEIGLAEVCREVLSMTDIARLRLGSLESLEVTDELLTLLKTEPRLMPHLHLPLQSGSNEILRAMNRRYTVEEYVAVLEKIRAAAPQISVSTDVIVGFPGETEEHFQETLNFVKAQKFSRVHVFPFSPRRGTPAATMENQVPPSVKKSRVHRLQKTAKQTAAEFAAAYIGQEVEVLWESRVADVTDGLTPNYLRVYTAADIPSGELERVRLTKLYADGLWGETAENEVK